MSERYTSSKTLLFLLCTAVFLFGFWGFVHAGMSMQAEGVMSDCPFSFGLSVCAMNPLEMLAVSQNMFTGLPLSRDLTSWLSLLLAFLLSLVFFGRFRASRESFPALKTFLDRVFLPPSFTQELFSSGILNPKTF